MKKETTESRVEHKIVYQLNTSFLTKGNSIKYIFLNEFFVIKRKESTNIGHIMCTLFEHNTPNFLMFLVVRQLR